MSWVSAYVVGAQTVFSPWVGALYMSFFSFYCYESGTMTNGNATFNFNMRISPFSLGRADAAWIHGDVSPSLLLDDAIVCT